MLTPAVMWMSIQAYARERMERRTTADIRFITLLRAMAALLVLWDHLVGSWLEQHHATWWLNSWVEAYVTTPLGIIQHLGFLAVALFFLISGFIITHVAQRENRLQFIVKRLFRIYPPFIVSVMLIFASNLLYSHLSGSTYGVSDHSRQDVLWAMTLLNYMRGRQQPVNGVAWTLVIEMLFYLVCFLLLPLVQRRPRIALSIVIALIYSVDLMCRLHGTSFFLFAVSLSYVPFLITGQIVYFVWSGRIRLWEGAIFFAANYFVLIVGLHDVTKTFYVATNSYGVSFMYALGLFLGLLFLGNRLRVPRPLPFIADISYSLYLYHGQVGILVLAIMYPHVAYPPALLFALLVVAIVSIASWYVVERPSQRAARSILAHGPLRLRGSGIAKPERVRGPETKAT